MALAEICGLADFDAFRKQGNDADINITNCNFNFTKNMELAVPPFSNVSISRVS